MSDRAQQYFAAVIPENWEDAQDRINSGVDTARKLLNNKDHRVQRQVEEFVDSVSGPDLVHTKTFTRAAKEAFKEVDINSDGTVGMLICDNSLLWFKNCCKMPRSSMQAC